MKIFKDILKAIITAEEVKYNILGICLNPDIWVRKIRRVGK